MKVVNVVGGLGSQMMAYAFSLALKDVYKKEKVVCDFSAYHHFGWVEHNGSELTEVFGIIEEGTPKPLRSVLHSKSALFRLTRRIVKHLGLIKWHGAKEKKYNYDDSVFHERGWVVVYNETWTSWKYFDSVKDDVLKVFQFRPVSDEKNKQVLRDLRKKNSVSIHVRLGDYKNSTIHSGLASLEYYRDAVNFIKSKVDNPEFFVFSDDVAGCTKYLNCLEQDEVKFIDWNTGLNSYIDMQLMASCKHHIIPNSSFSWWGAYLGRWSGQIVVAPAIWSNWETGVEIRDMNLPGWVIINNVISAELISLGGENDSEASI